MQLYRRGHGELDPTSETPPPPLPTEAELRERLRETITTYCAVDGAEQQAAEHVEACHARLSTFASLDSEVDACLISQVREAGRIELPDGQPSVFRRSWCQEHVRRVFVTER